MYVEIFNNHLLYEILKRILFSTRVYIMIMNLAVLDWVCSISKFLLWEGMLFYVTVLKAGSQYTQHIASRRAVSHRAASAPQ